MELAAFPLVATCVAFASPVIAAPVDLEARQAVSDALKLVDFSLAEVSVNQEPLGPLQIAVSGEGGESITLVLHPHSVRGEDFGFHLVGEDGAQRVEAPPPSTYRGTVAEEPTAKVAASFQEGELRALIFAADGGPTRAVEPVPDEAIEGQNGAHVLYTTDDIVPDLGQCGAEPIGGRVASPTPPSEGIFIELAELGIDCDNDYFVQEAGSDPITALALVEQIVNSVTFIYERDVQVTFALTNVIVRTVPGFYTGTSPGDLTNQIMQEWQSNQAGVPHDLAHLFTAKNMDSFIGHAYIGTVCNPGFKYAVSQAEFSLATNIGLVAHEIGHNFGATHCDADPVCNIMCSGLGGCSNDLMSFASEPIAEIEAYLDTIGCLSAFIIAPTEGCQLEAFDWVLTDSAFGTGEQFFQSGACSLNITGGDNGQAGATEWLTSACVDSTISTFVNYSSTDEGNFDNVYYEINGVETIIADNDSQGLMFVTFDVEAGDTFGFGVETLDGILGDGFAGIFGFSATSSVAQPSFSWEGESNAGGAAFLTGGCMDIVGGDIGIAGDTELNTFSCLTGTVTANANYTSIDTGNFDNAYRQVNGVQTIITDNDDQGNFPVTLGVESGDLFGYGVATLDGLFGPGLLVVTDLKLNAPPQRVSDLSFTAIDTAGGSTFVNPLFNTVTITGGDSGIGGDTRLSEVLACADVVVKARMDYSSSDSGTFDDGFYFVGDTETVVAANDDQDIIDVEFFVPANTSFGFGVNTADGLFGPGSLAVSKIRVFAVPSEACPPDFNNDGNLNVLDFVSYQGAFADQRKCADINGDSLFNVLDFVGYQGLFAAGCD